MKLNASTRIKAMQNWYESLNDEQKEGYLADHPDSKYAKEHSDPVNEKREKEQREKEKAIPDVEKFEPEKKKEKSDKEKPEGDVTDKPNPKSEDEGYGVWDDGKWKPMTKKQFEKDMHPDYIKKYGGKGPDAAPKSDREYDQIVKKELKQQKKAKKKKQKSKLLKFMNSLFDMSDIKFKGK